MKFAAAAAPSGLPPHPYRWTMLAGVWLLYYCFGLLSAAMAPLVLPITRDLSLSHSAMGSVLGAWPLVYIASAIPCGALLDRVGVRWALFLAALLLVASGALRGIAGGYLDMFLAVAVFGLGGPLISVGAPKVVGQWFEGSERGLAMGIYITGPAFGGITALSLTNSILVPLTGGWRGVLFVYAAFILAAGAVWLAISAHPAARAHERAAAEDRQGQLRVFVELLGLRVVRIVLVMAIGVFFFNHALNNWLPEILRSGGMDAATAGFWASIPTGVGILGALTIPRLAIPARRLRILFLLFIAACLASLLLHYAEGALLAVGLALQGIARSSMMTVTILVLMETREVGSRNMGAAGGLFFSAAEIGGVLGPLSVGFLYDMTGGFDAGLSMLTAVALVLMVLLWVLRAADRSTAVPG